MTDEDRQKRDQVFLSVFVFQDPEIVGSDPFFHLQDFADLLIIDIDIKILEIREIVFTFTKRFYVILLFVQIHSLEFFNKIDIFVIL